MKILLTNDDSHRSPLLACIIKFLSQHHEVLIVVPKHEQSWKSKSMTRFGYLHREKIEIAGHAAFTVDGTPADCVNIGVYNVDSGNKPDLVVSGINAGLNTGMGFVWASGTIGACLEANIAGIPGIAISQEFDSQTRNSYVADYLLPATLQERLDRQTSLVLTQVFELLLNKKNLLDTAITWNVNLPFQLNENFSIKEAFVAPSRYGRCYREIDASGGVVARYEHDLVDLEENSQAGSDISILRTGDVPITPLDIRCFGRN